LSCVFLEFEIKKVTTGNRYLSLFYVLELEIRKVTTGNPVVKFVLYFLDLEIREKLQGRKYGLD
jgi:hypothetical protein